MHQNKGLLEQNKREEEENAAIHLIYSSTMKFQATINEEAETLGEAMEMARILAI